MGQRTNMAIKKTPRVAPNGLHSWELDHKGVIEKCNQCGGLIHAMNGALSSFHIADPKLAKLFETAYKTNHKAQAILLKAMKETPLRLGVKLTGGREI